MKVRVAQVSQFFFKEIAHQLYNPCMRDMNRSISAKKKM